MATITKKPRSRVKSFSPLFFILLLGGLLVITLFYSVYTEVTTFAFYDTDVQKLVDILQTSQKETKDVTETSTSLEKEETKAEKAEAQLKGEGGGAFSDTVSTVRIPEGCKAELPITSALFDLNERIGTDMNHNCSYTLSDLPTTPAPVLQQQINDALKVWGYDRKVLFKKSNPFSNVAGRRVLDVGMGQGPWGAAMLGNPSLNLKYYVGLDPAVCPPIHARTRDMKIKRKGKQVQCLKAYGTTDLTDPRVLECTGGDAKYHPFPVNGLQMMAAYPGQVALLPGTFETLHSKLSKVVFDAVMLKTVTEHLEHLHSVFEGLWELLSQCSSHATLLIDHHNYYSYDGHHGYPLSSEQLKENPPPEMLELADWGHIHPNASVATDQTLNRVRPGDLQALLNVYFDCACTQNPVPKIDQERFDSEIEARLSKLGFAKHEFMAKHLFFQCDRRAEPLEPELVQTMILHHPPMDGSYRAQPFNCKLA